MSIEKNNKNTLSHENKGWTTLINETIQNIRNTTALAIYTYLASKPPGFNICKVHLRNHFECGRDHIATGFKYLQSMGLMEVKSMRDSKGRVVGWNTILKTKIVIPEQENIQITGNPYSGEISRLLKNQILDKPDSGKSAPIKERVLKKKDYKKRKTTNCESSSSLSDKPGFNHNQILDGFGGKEVIDLDQLIAKSGYQNNQTKKEAIVIKKEQEHFNSSSFYIFSQSFDERILNKKLKRDERTDKEFLEVCKDHVDNHSDKKYPRSKRIYALIKLLEKLNRDNIIFSTTSETFYQEKQKKDEKKSPFTNEELELANEYRHFKKLESLGGIPIEKAISDQDKLKKAIDIIQKIDFMEINTKCELPLNAKRSCLNSASNLVSRLF